MKSTNRGIDVESTEIQLARLDERLKMVLDRMEDNQESHNRTREWMRKTDDTLHMIGTRVLNVENGLSKAAPTIEEFLTIKHKIMGAGMAGRWMWVTFGTLLGLVISAREHIIRFFSQGS